MDAWICTERFLIQTFQRNNMGGMNITFVEISDKWNPCQARRRKIANYFARVSIVQPLPACLVELTIVDSEGFGMSGEFDDDTLIY